MFRCVPVVGHNLLHQRGTPVFRPRNNCRLEWRYDFIAFLLLFFIGILDCRKSAALATD